MNFTSADMHAMSKEGDAIDFVRDQGGLAGKSRRHPAEKIRCPWCGVASQERCTTKRGRAITVRVHEARIIAHQNLQKKGETP